MGEIIAGTQKHSLPELSYDAASDSDILIYGSKEKADWVAYMSQTTKNSRVNWYKDLNFGGSTDWAVDLMEFVDPTKDCKARVVYDPKLVMGDGSFMPYNLLKMNYAHSSQTQYVTIVNMAPYKFIVRKNTP